MAVWRLVFEKVATLQEIEQSWSLDDILRATALLDLKAEMQANYKDKGKA